ncbi:MAG TPA: hypothetical protein VNG51_00395 [Ktedonobacteraceae bacterium]|nr:hypothetical protein [Ktedonobacteraceae bacterium]
MQKTLARDTVLNHFISQLPHFRHIKKVELGEHGNAFSALLNGKRQPVQGVVLVRSSDYWEYRLHMQRSSVGLVVCYRHDSVVPVHVLALEDGRDYECEDLPGKYASLDVVRAERSRHAAKVFLGALLCGKKAAHDLLLNMDESTRRKYEARMHRYQRRQPGRPLAV